ncbi:M28 family peptidase [Halobaculum sp. MBLA0143]|uniref:M28 family peptidase n=1 Tax=Halobaculum sp. MBLA0143 TaxID=3079933 RepID=UPI003524A4C3
MDEIAAEFGRAWVADRPRTFLSELTGIDSRMAGSPGETRAAALVVDALQSAGVEDVTQESFELSAWSRGDATLTTTEPTERQFEAVALPYCPSASVSGPVVDVGHGSPEEIEAADLSGRVALASTDTPAGGRFLHRMEKFGAAADAGAVGFLFVNHVPGQLPPTGSLTFGREAEIPAVGVSHETGERLREHALSSAASHEDSEPTGPVTRVELDVDAETRPGESQNVVGHLGPETDDRLLLLAHYDAHDIAEGALDNGCGVATLLVAAGLLADAELDRGVTVAAVGAEEVGLLGSEHLAQTLDLETVAGVCNVDGAGRFRDLVAMAHSSTATASVARRVAERTGHPVAVQTDPHPFSDQWPFVRRGVPALQLHSRAATPPAATGDSPSGGVGAGRGWGHTHADTLDKVDVRNVREHGMLTALLVRELAAAELPRLETATLEKAFERNDFEPGMRAAGLWPDEWA